MRPGQSGRRRTRGPESPVSRGVATGAGRAAGWSPRSRGRVRSMVSPLALARRARVGHTRRDPTGAPVAPRLLWEVLFMKLSHPGRRIGAVVAIIALAMALSGAATAGGRHPKPHHVPEPIHVRVLSVNDFHGNLQPPAGSSGRITLSDGKTTVDAGGAAYLATAVKTARSEVKNSLFVAAGDLIGASPLASALFHDEPTIDLFNYLQLQASAVGNHEFDEGFAELKRMQTGGCHPVDGCQFEPTFSGADFPYLGSNVYDEASGRPAMQPFSIRIIGGVRVAIIGATLQALPDVVTPSAIAGLEFGDEAAAINRTSHLLSHVGIKVQIVVMHQGDNIGSGPGH